MLRAMDGKLAFLGFWKLTGMMITLSHMNFLAFNQINVKVKKSNKTMMMMLLMMIMMMMWRRMRMMS